MAKSQTTMEPDFDLNDAEDFKLPGAGIHLGNLVSAEPAIIKKTAELPEELQREQIIVQVALSQNDPDAPNLPMRLYLQLPYPEDKDTLWGSRTAWGAKIQTIKNVMTAFGGQESGGLNKSSILAHLNKNVGKAVKVEVEHRRRQEMDPSTGQYVNTEPPEFFANIKKLLPA